MIAVLDLFSAAAGGWSLGMHRAGFRTIAACEVVPWRRALYSENNPGVKVYDDVQTLTADRLRADLGGMPDIIVGIPPCQDISPANTKGKGVEGARSSLYFDAIRLVGECRPRWFAFENSSNLRTRGADAVLAALEGIGYACWPVVVRAGDVGANHERPRCWLIGCDLAQIADPDRQFPDDGAEQSGPEGQGSDLSGARAADRDFGGPAGAGPIQGRHGGMGEVADPEIVRCSARPGFAEQPGRADERNEPRHLSGTAAPSHPAEEGHAGRGAIRPGWQTRHIDARGDDTAGAGSMGSGNPADPDEARRPHGCVEPSLRPAKIADNGRRAGRGDDESRAGQMAVRPPDRRGPDGSRADWSLDDLADHIRLDDGLSAWLAGTRVAVGDGKGQSAASLVVEAFGDAVIPQIPEAIGRAILRTEAALRVAYGRSAA